MILSIKKPNQAGLLITLVEGGIINLIIGAMALILDIILEIPPLPINKALSIILFFLLISVYAGLLIWSIKHIVKAKKNKKLATTGPYSLCRHPMYAGIALLINPGLAIIFQSWALLEVSIILYFFWRYLAKKEEKELLKYFGEKYKNYSKKVGCLLPKIC